VSSSRIVAAHRIPQCGNVGWCVLSFKKWSMFLIGTLEFDKLFVVQAFFELGFEPSFPESSVPVRSHS
jgi:hypothetical protein